MRDVVEWSGEETWRVEDTPDILKDLSEATDVVSCGFLAPMPRHTAQASTMRTTIRNNHSNHGVWAKCGGGPVVSMAPGGNPRFY
jgi:hypothetical protein